MRLLIPEEMQPIADKTFFEFSRSLSNITFMVGDIRDSSYLDSDQFNELFTDLCNSVNNHILVVNSITNHFIGDAVDMRYDNMDDTITYKEVKL